MVREILVEGNPFNKKQPKEVLVEGNPFEPSNMIADVGKSIASGLSQIPAQVLGSGNDIANLVTNAGQYVGGKLIQGYGQLSGDEKARNYEPQYSQPFPFGTEKIKNFAESQGVPVDYEYDPKTQLGDYAKTGSNFVGSTIASKGKNLLSTSPAALAKDAKQALASAVSFETAKQIAPDNAVVQGIAAIAPSVIGGASKPSQFLREKTAIPVSGAAENIVKGVGNIKSGIQSRTPEQLLELSQQSRNTAIPFYEAIKKSGASINPNASNKIRRTIGAALREDGILNENLHKGTLSVVRDIRDRLRDTKKPVSIEELDQFRRLLSKSASQMGKQGATEDAARSMTALSALDDALNNITQKDLLKGTTESIDNLRNAQFNWAKASNLEKVTNLIERSGNDPRRLKVEFKNFVNNKKNLRGFNEEEIKLLKEAGSFSRPEQILTALGRFGLDFSSGNFAKANFVPSTLTLAGAGSTALGGGALAPALVGVVGAGTVARKTAGTLAKGKAENVIKQIEKRKQ